MLVSGTDDGKGPKSKYITVHPAALSDCGADATIIDDVAMLFPRCRELLVTVARHPEGIPALPKRAFASVYPQGKLSGMALHVDDMTAHGAVTLCLTDDRPGEGFFTSNVSGSAKVDVPLQAGQAVAIHPSWLHGVHECRRTGDRVSITLFY